MLILKLELHSARTGKVTEIGRTAIWSVGGTNERGDYEVGVARKKKDGAKYSHRDTMLNPLRRGRVEDYPRLSYNVWRLVIRALLSAFPEEENLRLKKRDEASD